MYSCSPVRPGTVQALIREWQARQDTLEMEAKYYQARAADKSELLHFAEVEHQIFRLENKELTERVNELENLLKQEQTTQQALAEKEHELQELAIENRRLNTQVAVVQAESNIAVNEVEGLLTDNIKLQDEKAKLQGETARLRNEVAQTRKDCITAMNMVENVAGQLEFAKKDNEHLVAQVQETNAKYIQADHEKGRAMVKVHQMQAQVEMTQEALELETDQANKLVITLKAEVATKAEEIDVLKAEVAAKAEQIEALKAQVRAGKETEAEKAAQQEIQQTNELVESLKAELDAKRKELQAQEGAERHAQQELRKNNELVESLKANVDMKNKELQAQEEAENHAQQELQKNNELVKSLKSELDAKRKELQAQAGTEKHAQEELQKNQELVKSLQNELADQQEEIQYLTSHLTLANIENEEIMDKYSKNLKKLDYYQIYTKSLEKSVKNLQDEMVSRADENRIAQRLEKPKRKRTEDRKPLTQVQAFIAKVTSPLSPKWQKKPENGIAKERDERPTIKRAKTTRH